MRSAKTASKIKVLRLRRKGKILSKLRVRKQVARGEKSWDLLRRNEEAKPSSTSKTLAKKSEETEAASAHETNCCC